MSVKVMSYVWDHSQAKGSELLMLLAIADHAAEDGYCWPTIESLADKTRLDRRSVIRLVKSLEARGELHVVRSNRNNRYVVTMGRDAAQIEAVLACRKEAIGDKLSPDKMSRDAHVTSIGDIDVTSIGDTGVTLIINEPSIEPSTTEKNRDKKSVAKKTPKPSGEANGIGPWFLAVASACSIDLNAATGRQKGMLKTTAETMRDKVHATPEQIEGFREWWAGTWRGKGGAAPTIAQLREHWGEFSAATDTADAGVVKLGR